MKALYFDLEEKKRHFPDTADSLIVDMYLEDSPQSSIRLFRVYAEVPKHYHKQCDEVLVVVEGALEFQTGSDARRILAANQLVIFKRNTVHSIKPFDGKPVYFLSIDTPRREESDVHFVEPIHKNLKFITHI
ncbi:Cupin domain [Serratia entomophila]|jgi:mannose-6-phosphate isomerase-like protein (cupin superfamily)|uniref:cupin domain-containing protein n=1 Tax=Serratia entomophila TaxID=42906 RepID=UPI001F26E0EB|nr:cupin domain-containing protein [Serratia entomophila]UIW16842.1 cupin domain-containing protein [Serratia entomophila]CAI0722615.1 Cupin domain [Serratia entomophila]CAI0723579.1 Cupin domain [Serratia entomophila]CAI0723993.1 Cupin domain [Serratia entomophila]CAI0729453.1 Cupin domain [Serratia entomophila]